MLFEELPKSLDKCRFVSKGATRWVFEAAPGIAIKYFVRGRLDEFQVENEIYDLIERNHPPPLFIRSFLRLPGLNFMQLMADNLDARLQRNQRRDFEKHVCLEVLRLEPTPKIEQWAAELSAALAWLESLGLVQGDLRPTNLLLDSDDHLKLADFDSSCKIGAENLGLAPPWSRVLGKEGGQLYGTFGLCGAQSEQFAFGSILYNLTRGFEPYEDKGVEAVSLWQNMVLPQLSDSRLDALTLCCWKGDFATLADLAKAVAVLEGAKRAATAIASEEGGYMSKMKGYCEKLLQENFADLDVGTPAN
ncbi:hypothetical protein LLEC1_07153 [Akanthomyces lecanii]|uniref:Protein kinase domain-containing protein n=1 Tax=Cordyceps confragosa TaxID=2714763 RepID=A0A179ILI5_CORDF|nr:hypothetical protein LLEC1_07153 [Akanthomyces lecanii]